MLAFLKLIRIQNLLIIAFTQYMVRWCLLAPELSIRGFELQLSNFQFFLLSLSTVMIAAAGYVINDYFDVRIDKVNKPERMVIDKGVKRRVAIGAHTVINFIAITIGFALSYSVGMWKLVIFHIVCAAGLWFYSTTFKRKFFIGNFIIAIFTALVPIVVGVYELVPFHSDYDVECANGSKFGFIWLPLLAISFFAFITTLLREILKDIEDMDGDKEFGCKTMPIVLGVRTSKLVVIVLSIATMICLACIQYRQLVWNDLRSFFYFSIALQLPFIFLIWKTWKAENKKEFRLAGNTAKFIMFMGVCYLFIYALTIYSAA
jgi:4-hydroxybenzoate polyprenyltransferase